LALQCAPGARRDLPQRDGLVLDLLGPDAVGRQVRCRVGSSPESDEKGEKRDVMLANVRAKAVKHQGNPNR
jgi:hypothetical protein